MKRNKSAEQTEETLEEAYKRLQEERKQLGRCKKGRAKEEIEELINIHEVNNRVMSTGLLMENGDHHHKTQEILFHLDGLSSQQAKSVRYSSLLHLANVCKDEKSRDALRMDGLISTILDALVKMQVDETCAATTNEILNLGSLIILRFLVLDNNNRNGINADFVKRLCFVLQAGNESAGKEQQQSDSEDSQKQTLTRRTSSSSSSTSSASKGFLARARSRCNNSSNSQKDEIEDENSSDDDNKMQKQLLEILYHDIKGENFIFSAADLAIDLCAHFIQDNKFQPIFRQCDGFYLVAWYFTRTFDENKYPLTCVQSKLRLLETMSMICMEDGVAMTLLLKRVPGLVAQLFKILAMRMTEEINMHCLRLLINLSNHNETAVDQIMKNQGLATAINQILSIAQDESCEYFDSLLLWIGLVINCMEESVNCRDALSNLRIQNKSQNSKPVSKLKMSGSSSSNSTTTYAIPSLVNLFLKKAANNKANVELGMENGIVSCYIAVMLGCATTNHVVNKQTVINALSGHEINQIATELNTAMSSLTNNGDAAAMDMAKAFQTFLGLMEEAKAN